MKDLAGLVILGASVLLPVGVARATLGFIISRFSRKPAAPRDELTR